MNEFFKAIVEKVVDGHRVGVSVNKYQTHCLPSMTVEQLKALRDEISEYIGGVEYADQTIHLYGDPYSKTYPCGERAVVNKKHGNTSDPSKVNCRGCTAKIMKAAKTMQDE
jgi:hypothetical protein